MTTSPPQIAQTTVRKKVHAIVGFAFGAAATLAATGNLLIGAILGMAFILYGALRSGFTPEERRRFLMSYSSALLVAMCVLFVFQGIVTNWADFKQGFVEGWNSF